MSRIYKISYIILLCIAFTICTMSPPLIGKEPYVEKGLKPYVDQWVKDALKHEADLTKYYEIDSITFKNFVYEPHVLGKCWTRDLKIEITKKDSLNNFQLFVIVYHELGHCALDKNHTCDRLAIMNPSFELKDYKSYYSTWDYLIDDYWDGRGIDCFWYNIFGGVKKSTCKCE